VKIGICAGALILALGFVAGCSKAPNDKEAIRAAILKHLTDQGGLNMAAMDMEVKQVAIKGDDAEAQVEFRVKQGGGSMQVAYKLQRVQGAWVVGHGQPAGGQIAHPPMDKQAPGSPTAGATSDFPALDKFKKPGPAPEAGALPPGHPPVSSPPKPPR
jgi:hypothetical protein